MAQLSYSMFVTLIRNQGPGGCGTMTSLSILDILKKYEAYKLGNTTFAPNFSFAFAEHMYNDPKSGVHGKQLEVLMKYGCCPETSMPSNFDAGPTPAPTPDQIAEAKLYLIKGHGPEEDPALPRIKDYLHRYGPLWTTGYLVKPQPGDEGHVFALIGYDDIQQTLSFVNSYGDGYGKNGIGTIPYANLTNASLFPHIDKIRYVENYPTPILAISAGARIRITTTARTSGNGLELFGRNMLRVKLGVADEPALVVWDRNNHWTGVGSGLVGPGSYTLNCGQTFDDSKTLFIDVALPKYWTKHWPISAENRWYLDVENHSVPQAHHYLPTIDAKVQEFSIKAFVAPGVVHQATNLPQVGPAQSVRVLI